MSAKHTGLGRGFDSLIPQNFDNTLLVDEKDRIKRVAVTAIHPDDKQPRQHFDEQALSELAVSLKRHGVLQPLVVTPHGKDKFQIVAGERRWRAAQIAKLGDVPVIVRTLEELERLEIALVENVQRVDLSPLEQAVSIERLHQQFNMTYDQIGQRLGKSVSALSNTVRLLQLPPAAREALVQKRISEGHARSILALKNNPGLQAQLLRSIEQHGWSVREAERFVLSVKSGEKDKRAVQARVSTETPQTRALSKRLQAPVHIRRTAKGGKLEIGFASDEELAQLIERIG